MSPLYSFVRNFTAIVVKDGKQNGLANLLMLNFKPGSGPSSNSVCVKLYLFIWVFTTTSIWTVGARYAGRQTDALIDDNAGRAGAVNIKANPFYEDMNFVASKIERWNMLEQFLHMYTDALLNIWITHGLLTIKLGRLSPEELTGYREDRCYCRGFTKTIYWKF